MNENYLFSPHSKLKSLPNSISSLSFQININWVIIYCRVLPINIGICPSTWTFIISLTLFTLLLLVIY
jgi:hypothetical protein